MPAPASQPSLSSASSATATSSPAFVETTEFNRFVEFSDACRQYRYIGLCFGPPELASRSRLSATAAPRGSYRSTGGAPRRRMESRSTPFSIPRMWSTHPRESTPISAAPARPSPISLHARSARRRATLDKLRVRDEQWRQAHRDDSGYRSSQVPPLEPTCLRAFEEYETKTRSIPDPTTLVMVDEADRLRMSSLEQLRSIFDASGLGMVLIGMPGIEKRLARYPQFYSRIGFVHEFRPLGKAEIEELLGERWTPPGVTLPREPFAPEIVARIVQLPPVGPAAYPARTGTRHQRCEPSLSSDS
jgi:hypothetical protein